MSISPHPGYKSESKVSQDFINVKHNSPVADTFAKGLKMVNYTELWDTEFAW